MNWGEVCDINFVGHNVPYKTVSVISKNHTEKRVKINWRLRYEENMASIYQVYQLPSAGQGSKLTL